MSTDYDAIRLAVDAKLNDLGIVFAIVHKGAMFKLDFGTDGKPWDCDQWEATLHRATSAAVGYDVHTAPLLRTDYYTGSGHRKVPAGKQLRMVRALKNEHPSRHAAIRAQYLAPVAPTAADVLHSLLLDGEAVNSCFADWCSEFGYDSDSIKALSTYTACCAIGQDLRKVFPGTAQDELRTMLQDF